MLFVDIWPWVLLWYSGRVGQLGETGTVWLVKFQIFTIFPFTENVCPTSSLEDPLPMGIRRRMALLSFPAGSVVKNLPASAGDVSSIPGSGRSPEKEMGTHSSIFPGKPHGQRSWWAIVRVVTKESIKTWWLNNNSETVLGSFVC